jgi:hypothetical protein
LGAIFAWVKYGRSSADPEIDIFSTSPLGILQGQSIVWIDYLGNLEYRNITAIFDRAGDKKVVAPTSQFRLHYHWLNPLSKGKHEK